MNKKDQLINDLLEEIKYKKTIYGKKMKRFHLIDYTSEAFITFCNAVAMSSLFVTLADMNKTTLIIGSILTTVSSVSSAVKRVIGIQQKMEMCNTTYHQLSDLLRETKIILIRNHLNSDDYQNLLNDVSNRLSLIDDSALPIKIVSESRDEKVEV